MRLEVEKIKNAVNTVNWEAEIEKHVESFEATNFLRVGIRKVIEQAFQLPFAQCLEHLIQQDSITLKELQNVLSSLVATEDVPLPTLSALLAFKDYMKIGDDDWHYVGSLFGLKYATITHIRALRKEVNAEVPVQPIDGGKGAEILLLPYLKWILSHSPPPQMADGEKIKIKFSFDGGTMTSKKRVQEELGTFELLYDHLTLAQAKSPKNTHQYMIYLGGESREEFEQNFRNAAAAVEYLQNGGTVKVGEQEYAFEPFLVCDMKCLVEVLGLYCVYHTSSKWRCPWCKVSDADLANFSIESHPLRDLEEMKNIASGARSRSGRKKNAREKFGVMGGPIFCIPFDHILPCNLHAAMAIIRKLLSSLLESFHAAKEAELVPLVEQAFEKMKVTLIPAKSTKDAERSLNLQERIKKSRFNRPELLRILKNYELLVSILLDYAKEDEELHSLVSRVRTVWAEFLRLFSLAVQRRVKITEKEWLEMARPFGRSWVSALGGEDVTTYLHVFVYHFGFFLEKYGTIEFFANYGIEGTVGKTKQNIKFSTSGFKNKAGSNSAAIQQLQVAFREKHHEATGLLVDKRKHRPGTKEKKSWADEMIDLHPDMKKYIP